MSDIASAGMMGRTRTALAMEKRYVLDARYVALCEDVQIPLVAPHLITANINGWRILFAEAGVPDEQFMVNVLTRVSRDLICGRAERLIKPRPKFPDPTRVILGYEEACMLLTQVLGGCLTTDERRAETVTLIKRGIAQESREASPAPAQGLQARPQPQSDPYVDEGYLEPDARRYVPSVRGSAHDGGGGLDWANPGIFGTLQYLPRCVNPMDQDDARRARRAYLKLDEIEDKNLRDIAHAHQLLCEVLPVFPELADYPQFQRAFLKIDKPLQLHRMRCEGVAAAFVSATAQALDHAEAPAHIVAAVAQAHSLVKYTKQQGGQQARPAKGGKGYKGKQSGNEKTSPARH